MTTAQQRRALGTFGEGVAERRLVEAGMVVLDRNWRCRHGEIDLVLRDGDTLVVCEVKTRRGLGHGHPVEAITPAKAARLRDLAERWRHERGLTRVGVRIDVVAVLADGRGPADVLHIRGAL